MVLRLTLALFLAAWVSAGEPATQERVESLVTTLCISEADFDMTSQDGTDRYKAAAIRAEMATDLLTTILTKQPRAWRWARASLQRLPRGKSRHDQKTRMVEVLSLDADPSSRVLLTAELKRNAKQFPSKALIRLDRHGVKEARTRLIQVVNEKPGFGNLQAAIHLGLAGCKASRPVLTWARDKSAVMHRFTSDAYGTALALRRLGDASSWKDLRSRAGRAVAAYLKKDNFETARWYAIQLEFYVGLTKAKDDIDVLALNQACTSYVVARMSEIDSMEDLHRLLQACAPEDTSVPHR